MKPIAKMFEKLGFSKKPTTEKTSPSAPSNSSTQNTDTSHTQKFGSNPNIILAPTPEYPLIAAAEAGDIEKVNQLLLNQHDVNEADKSGKTALHIACMKGNSELASILLIHGANIEAKRCNITSFEAAGRHFYKNIKAVMPLMDACSNPCPAIVRDLLKAGASTEAITSTHKTALHYACYEGNGEIIQLLIDRKANTIAQDEDGCTPLHFLCSGKIRENIIPTINLLLKNHGDADITTRNGYTALHYALQSDNPNKYPLVEALIPVTDINKANGLGELPLHIACAQKDVRLISLLAPNTINVNALDSGGNTPLMLLNSNDDAGLQGAQYLECLNILRENGAQVPNHPSLERGARKG